MNRARGLCPKKQRPTVAQEALIIQKQEESQPMTNRQILQDNIMKAAQASQNHKI